MVFLDEDMEKYMLSSTNAFIIIVKSQTYVIPQTLRELSLC